jgi:uncharacterized damage-inducible protein DinB
VTRQITATLHLQNVVRNRGNIDRLNRKRMKRLILLPLFSLFSQLSNAQCTLGETVKAQLIEDWKLAKVLTNEYLTIMPSDKYNFKAQDNIRSFAQQMLHVAQVNNAMISNGTGAPRIFSPLRRLEQSPGAQTKDSVLYYVNASYDFAINAIKHLDASKLEEKVKERTLELTRFAWLQKAFAHQVHHRGQTAIYIRLVGIKPPNWLE